MRANAVASGDRWEITCGRDEAISAQRADKGAMEPAAEATREQPSVVLRAAHHGMVEALAAEAPAFAAVAALTARWVAGHMFSGMVAHQEVGELLAAALWSGPSTLPPPGQSLLPPRMWHSYHIGCTLHLGTSCRVAEDRWTLCLAQVSLTTSESYHIGCGFELGTSCCIAVDNWTLCLCLPAARSEVPSFALHMN